MSTTHPTREDQKIPTHEDRTSSEMSLKTNANGMILIPQPSDDSKDPLNWPMSKKIIVVSVLFLSMFVGFAAPFCGQLNIQQQAKLYHKTTIQITYFNSAASAGLATGGFIWWPLSHKFGHSAVIFWCLIGVLATQIWAPLMTKPDQYVPYLISRYFSAFFGIVVSILGPKYLTDMFFLHQRGRAFTVLHLALNFGASAGPTFSGFVAANSTGRLNTVFFFLEDTAYHPSEERTDKSTTQSFLSQRFEIFFKGGSRNSRSISWGAMFKVFFRPFKLFTAPVILIIAGFDTISFAFYVALNALTPVWLQLPKKAHGIYGFSVADNAAFTFVHWIGCIIGLIYGHFVSDRIPLWFIKRNNGVWKPEYRLHALWPTNFVLMPLGLGLVGIAMEYRLNWIVMAIGQLFVTIGSLVSIPVTVNYICECFRTHTTEATLILNSLRLWFGLSINFYVNPWIDKVGIGWVYGMMAFFCVFAFLFLILLMLFGHAIREATPFIESKSEEGQHVLADGERTASTPNV
ncbi:Major facilitator superfamily domain, general substrate transporter [Penicillium occitanis (nom. inval.)]|nr:hypothetical protein PENOC_103370 [Penicillium occitanis (nom. inval.)]PCG98653.1 Major facilitator superfamily domain, general substrate transporter [Penicillium occitanis (nom. inval.)]